MARDVPPGIDRGRDTLSTPCFRRWIPTVLRAIPELIFERLGR